MDRIYEDAALKMTEIGIGTCWIRGFFDRNLIRNVIEIKEGEINGCLHCFGIEKKAVKRKLRQSRNRRDWI
ncbi:hypothetical protein [Geosporobacter ferrireducens]|uniref:Uncharacterized protein n=1 Tax=Geosporobacter ferrireducens TaxID=1424294 RepID=A0A1D8GMR5_9FIRM|nr:hypothetical protein [Geosporobacter ferrireducens]AOT72185.1 hypothetical protein Gferi_23160 [Geosporobacter ferrireducens]MTI56075.1 hypothetical protein [Geosporobacter ferrireducens]